MKENIKIYGFDNMGGTIINQWGTYKRNKRDILKEIIYNGKIYTLCENIEGFYNKALVYNNNNNYLLMSYDTVVTEYNDKIMYLYGYYSQTTAKHINSFLEKFGFQTMSKKEIENTKILIK